jgi:hypothetical protein
MPDAIDPSYTAFDGSKRIASGSLSTVAVAVQIRSSASLVGPLLIFDNGTGRCIDVDLQGSASELASRLSPPAVEARGRGRPKLGVVAREVTLLPRHWEWLGTQPGGASVALRRLVEEARRSHRDGDARRRRQEAAYHFMIAMAGDLPGFEEAIRALFSGDRAKLQEWVAAWPDDIRDHLLMLAS